VAEFEKRFSKSGKRKRANKCEGQGKLGVGRKSLGEQEETDFNIGAKKQET